jgi:REP element-mobilizing transposase RayT
MRYDTYSETRFMPHPYVQNVLHIVFSTKGRVKSIPPQFLPRMWAYVAGICRNHKIEVHAVGGWNDHIHLLVEIPATASPAQTVLTIKSNSSRWAREEGLDFAWQEGYGAFSVCASHMPVVIQFIRDQEFHHRKASFDGEFISLLNEHGLKFDPKFIFG